MSQTATSPNAILSPRQHLEAIYDDTGILIPDWLLTQHVPETNEGWRIFGSFLPALMLPVYRDAVQTHPTRLVACARSGIPLGDSVRALAEAFSMPVPSADGLVHTYKISADTKFQDQIAHVQPFLEAAERAAPDDLHITVMDGIINRGRTFERAKRICTRLGIGECIRWIGFASGTGVEKTGASYIAWPHCESPGVVVAWEDRSDVLGLSYAENLRTITQNPDAQLSTTVREAQMEGAQILAGILTVRGTIDNWTRSTQWKLGLSVWCSMKDDCKTLVGLEGARVSYSIARASV